jgi:hypothetical protein
MQSVQVNTESRVVRASWTREMSQDLNIHHGLDFEDELSKMLKRELSKERCNKRKKSIDKIFKLQKTS